MFSKIRELQANHVLRILYLVTNGHPSCAIADKDSNGLPILDLANSFWVYPTATGCFRDRIVCLNTILNTSIHCLYFTHRTNTFTHTHANTPPFRWKNVWPTEPVHRVQSTQTGMYDDFFSRRYATRRTHYHHL